MFDEKQIRSSSSLEVQAIMLLVDEIRELKNLIRPTEVIKATDTSLVDYTNMKRNELMAEMKKNNPPNGWVKWGNKQMIDYLETN